MWIKFKTYLINKIKSLIRILYRIRNLINRNLPRAFYRSKFLSSFYYTFFSTTFYREHQAVLTGRVSHSKLQENFFRLVRNTHRIEKGLIMRPRRNIFAKQYLPETLDAFEKIWQNPDKNMNSQLEWSKDVLSEYFKVVGADPIIEENKERFKKVIFGKIRLKESHKQGILFKPYARSTTICSSISYDDFYTLVKQRRSVRWFDNKIVPRELIDKAIHAAIQSPSACNRQPFEFRIFDDKSMLNSLVNLPMGTVGFSDNIPVLVVVIGNLNAYDSERDRHLIYVDASLANMSFMLALETLGLSSCPINWPDIEKRERSMEKALNLEKFQRPIMCMAVGYADQNGEIPFSEKRSIELIRRYN